MVKWTDDATEYLEGYLRQVSALARRNGDDVDEIVSGLREHIEQKASTGGVTSVDLDLLLEVLNEVGSPSDVMAVDGEGVPEYKQQAHTSSNQTVASPVDPQVIIKKSSTGRWIFAVVMVLLFVLSIPVLLMVAAILLPALSRAREAALLAKEEAQQKLIQTELRASCASQLEQIGEALYLYTLDNEGRYPTMMDGTGGVRDFHLADLELFPTYLTEEDFLVCPSQHQSTVDGEVVDTVSHGIDSYIYPYMATRTLGDWQTFAMKYVYVMSAELESEPIPAEWEYLLFANIDDLDASSIPIVIERPGHHDPDGGHVLFLDGHVEYIKMGTKYPMVPEFFDGLTVFESWVGTMNARIEAEGRSDTP